MFLIRVWIWLIGLLNNGRDCIFDNAMIGSFELMEFHCWSLSIAGTVCVVAKIPKCLVPVNCAGFMPALKSLQFFPDVGISRRFLNIGLLHAGLLYSPRT